MTRLPGHRPAPGEPGQSPLQSPPSEPSGWTTREGMRHGSEPRPSERMPWIAHPERARSRTLPSLLVTPRGEARPTADTLHPIENPLTLSGSGLKSGARGRPRTYDPLIKSHRTTPLLSTAYPREPLRCLLSASLLSATSTMKVSSVDRTLFNHTCYLVSSLDSRVTANKGRKNRTPSF